MFVRSVILLAEGWKPVVGLECTHPLVCHPDVLLLQC
jgi:hypothetical protein